MRQNSGQQNWTPNPRAVHKAAVKDAHRAISKLPCCECGGVVIEFTVPNDVWNAIVRRGGKEHDREYLCVQCFAQQCVNHVSEQQEQGDAE